MAAAQALLGKTPKAALHEHFQRQGIANRVKWDVLAGAPPPADPCYTCTLTIPSDTECTGGNPAPQMVFTAQSRTKKGAEHAAATLALQHLNAGQAPTAAATHPPATSSDLQQDAQVSAMQVVKRQRTATAPAVLAAQIAAAAPTVQANGRAAAQEQQQGNGATLTDAARADPEANEGLKAFLDGLQPEDMKRLLIEAQNRIVHLEDQVKQLEGRLSRYVQWHRQAREVILKDI